MSSERLCVLFFSVGAGSSGVCGKFAPPRLGVEVLLIRVEEWGLK